MAWTAADQAEYDACAARNNNTPCADCIYQKRIRDR